MRGLTNGDRLVTSIINQCDLHLKREKSLDSPLYRPDPNEARAEITWIRGLSHTLSFLEGLWTSGLDPPPGGRYVQTTEVCLSSDLESKQDPLTTSAPLRKDDTDEY
ncbi:hypothetical protein NP233_g7795 [Leucocoprinus birnbaumii]|uniref:Uncharacterized protein n=1 Tax=Leucocoprinus birnbaumii TaxID=56174 RepID=A0AAD5VNH7_9AGAR|nr:hypothetical protein NP233_g7795 [Leucocoprinus birnbaumii]